MFRRFIASLIAIVFGMGASLVATGPAQAAPAPTVSITAAPAGGGAVTVTGTGFATSEPGIYLGLGPAGLSGFYAGAASLIPTEIVWIAVGNPTVSTGTARTEPLSKTGTFSVNITVPAPTDKTPAYAIYTSKAHGVGTSDTSQNTTTPVTYGSASDGGGSNPGTGGNGSEPETATPSISAKVSSISSKGVVTVRVVGSDFGDVSQAYAAVIRKGTERLVSGSNRTTAFGDWTGSSGITGGKFTKKLTAKATKWDPSRNYEVIVWTVSGTPTSANTYARADVAVTGAQSKAITRAKTAAASAASKTAKSSKTSKAAKASAGSLTWGVSTSFRSYVVGPIAQGAIITSSSVTTKSGAFTFGQSGASTYSATKHSGSVSYRGTVSFTGHGGIMNVVVKNPRIVITSAKKATLYVESGGSEVAMATLALGTPKTASSGATTFTRVPATLTATGLSTLFEGTPPSSGLDPVTFTIGSAAKATTKSSKSSTDTVSKYTKKATVSSSTSSTTTKSAAAKPAVVNGCAVADATLEWGFKESFRAYIDGSIANGSWSEKGNASYNTPNFVWKQGEGNVDSAASAVSVGFTGSVTFTGHSGVLDMTVSNPTLSIADASTGYILLDVKNTTMEGVAVKEKQVSFAKLDLAGVSLVPDAEGAVTLTGVPASLTAEGAAAFGTYPEGEALDPVTLVLPVASDCAVDSKPSSGAAAEESPSATSSVAPSSVSASAVAGATGLAVSNDDNASPIAIYVVVGILILLVGAAGGWLLGRRGRSQLPTGGSE